MDDNKTAKTAAKKSKNPLVVAAEVIGSAAGTVASTLGVHPHDEPTPKAAAPTPGKLLKKNKSRLPRRQKKALKRQQSAAKP